MADARKQLMERTCAECGRPYIYHNHWTYKMTINEKAYNFCSWGCMRKREAEVQKEKEEKRKEKMEEKTEIKNDGCEYCNNSRWFTSKNNVLVSEHWEKLNPGCSTLIQIKENRVEIYKPMKLLTFRIDYCPYCGRKLEKEDKTNE